MVNAKIYYSLDGHTPTAKSHLYTKPFIMEHNKPGAYKTTIKMRTYGADANGNTAINDKSKTVIANFYIV